MKLLFSCRCFLALLLLLGAKSEGPQEQAWGILLAATSQHNSLKRAEAVRVLGLLPGNPKALGIVEKALDDKEPMVRVAAVTALGQMGAKSCIPRLKQMLADKQAPVVLATAHALRALHDPTAYEVFYEVLTGERKPKQGLVAEGMETLKDRKKLAMFGFEEGIGFIPFASYGYTAVKALTKDDISPVRVAAAKILASDPDPRTGAALVRATADKSWLVRAAALDAIAKRGDPGLLTGIVPALSDKKDSVRYTAAAAVLRLTDLQKSGPHKK